jgi:glycine/D-amino acid oxidase-like deaminating enzyme
LPEDLSARTEPAQSDDFTTPRNYIYYYRLTPDRRMLFGGRAAFFPESGDSIRKSAEILRLGHDRCVSAIARRKWSSLSGVERSTSLSTSCRHAGQMDGMYYAVGYAGHGVAMATYQGQLMAQRIAGEKPDNPFDGIPFAGSAIGPDTTEHPWFLPFAGAYYKFLDWVS